jgi:glycosyltransferase involved in cell wall biosynthesis
MAGVPWGGSEELWAALAQEALQNNIPVSICLPERPRPHHKRFEALEKAGANVFCRSETRFYVRARQISRLAEALHPRLGAFVRERLSQLLPFFSTCPDVLLISDGPSIPSLRTMDAVQRYQLPRPYVILSQSNIGETPATHHRRRARAFYEEACYALFVSEANLRATERQLSQRLTNARIVKNPVNLDSLDLESWPPGQSTCFASVARLKIQDKGQDILFEVLSEHKWQQRDWHLSLFGSGDDKAYLEDLATFYSLNDRVTFRGQSEDIRSVWATHHALLLPSRLEGTPLAMVEAMLCGRPVVGTAVAGIPEWVSDGHTGFVAVAPNVSCFAATLERAWQQRARWREMGSKARERALSMYDPAPGRTMLSILTEAHHHRIDSW